MCNKLRVLYSFGCPYTEVVFKKSLCGNSDSIQDCVFKVKVIKIHCVETQFQSMIVIASESYNGNRMC